MYKRYLTVIIVLIVLVGCFFLFFDKPTNKELYTEYFNKLESNSEYDSLVDNDEIKINIEHSYLNNRYHYVVTFTGTTTLNNFKAMVVPNESKVDEYYPSFGILDNENVNLVASEAGKNEAKGDNLVISNRDKIEAFKIYVSYNSYEYYYLISVGE